MSVTLFVTQPPADLYHQLSSQKYAQIHYEKEEIEAQVDSAMQANDDRTVRLL